MNSWPRSLARSPYFRPSLLLTASLCVGLLVGFKAPQTGTHDFSQIVEVSLTAANSGSISGAANVIEPYRTSPGRHLPFIILFSVTAPETLAIAQSQGVILAWIIGFGFVPAAAYLAGEAIEPGYGKFLLAGDVLYRVSPWSKYQLAQPQYVLAAGFGYLCLAVILSRDLRPDLRGVGIGTMAAMAVWVTPVAGILVTCIGAAALVSERDTKALAGAAITGFVVCSPLLLFGSGSARILNKMLVSTGIFTLISPYSTVYLPYLVDPKIVLPTVAGGVVAVISDRETLDAIGALTFISGAISVVGDNYFIMMGRLQFFPMLVVVIAMELADRDILLRPRLRPE